MKIGYARVSRDEQNLTRQIEALKADGCERIFTEKMGGGIESRPELAKMLELLKPGDCVTVQKLDRLGRGFIHLNVMLERFEKEGILFRSLGESFDTSSAVGKAMLRMMTIIAELEKDMIKDRIKDALASARRNGKVLGRPFNGDINAQLARFKELGGDKEKCMREMGITEYKYYALKKHSKLPPRLDAAMEYANDLLN